MGDLGALAAAMAEPPEASEAMAGPTPSTNWVIKGLLLMGPPPGQSGAMGSLVGSGVSAFVDVRDGAVGTSEQQPGELKTVRFVLDVNSFQDRVRQRMFLYHLVDLMAEGQCLYLFDNDGHLKCGLVAACLLAGLFQWQPAKSLNRINQLHGCREKSDGFDCPRTSGPQAARTADLRAYVKDMQEGWAYTRGAGEGFLRPATRGSPAPRRPDSSGDRPPSSRSKHSGGGETSFDFRGGGFSQPRPGSRPTPQQASPAYASSVPHTQSASPQPSSPQPPSCAPAGAGAAAARGLRPASPSPQPSPRTAGSHQVVSTHLLERQGGSWGFSLAPAVIVTRVDPESPAAYAGVRAGTVLLAVDGTPVDTVDACAGLLSGVQQAELAVSSGPLARSGAM
eukprot:TRINITY_DN16293_c0_g1_i1.p1 TRINITY_DN16293_c0_g1~~TRINITY_DN16293_c0_g1_i1.p1  ORF type:complete len:394 (+),score=83.02 TRINITY_DN16293_c0_g1_i1:71-1252(+)